MHKRLHESKYTNKAELRSTEHRQLMYWWDFLLNKSQLKYQTVWIQIRTDKHLAWSGSNLFAWVISRWVNSYGNDDCHSKRGVITISVNNLCIGYRYCYNKKNRLQDWTNSYRYPQELPRWFRSNEHQQLIYWWDSYINQNSSSVKQFGSTSGLTSAWPDLGPACLYKLFKCSAYMYRWTTTKRHP